MTSEVKINYAYVIMQDICNKFIEVDFCVGWMYGFTANIEHLSNIDEILVLYLLLL